MSSSCIKWRSKVVDQFHLYSKIREKRKMGSVQRTISGTSRCRPTKGRAKNERSHEVLLICGFHFSPDPGCFGLFFVSFFLFFSFSVLAALLRDMRPAFKRPPLWNSLYLTSERKKWVNRHPFIFYPDHFEVNNIKIGPKLREIWVQPLNGLRFKTASIWPRSAKSDLRGTLLFLIPIILSYKT